MSGSVKISESERQEHVRHFLHKTCNEEVSGSFTLESCKTTAKKCTKKVCCTCKVAFLLIRPTIRPIVVFQSWSLPLLLSITRFYILLEQTAKLMLSRSSLLALAKSIYYRLSLLNYRGSLHQGFTVVETSHKRLPPVI